MAQSAFDDMVTYKDLQQSTQSVIEDGCDENDWEVEEVTDAIGDTNACRRRSLRNQHSIPKKGIDLGVANSILVKVNQIGTLTEILTPSKWRRKQTIPLSSLTVVEKPRIQRSLISQ